MIFLRYLITMLLLAIACPAYAITPASELTALVSSMHSMQADFTQAIYDNRGKAVQQSYGHMAILRPGKFRWEIVKPIPQLIIANENHFLNKRSL